MRRWDDCTHIPRVERSRTHQTRTVYEILIHFYYYYTRYFFEKKTRTRSSKNWFTAFESLRRFFVGIVRVRVLTLDSYLQISVQTRSIHGIFAVMTSKILPIRSGATKAVKRRASFTRTIIGKKYHSYRHRKVITSRRGCKSDASLEYWQKKKKNPWHYYCALRSYSARVINYYQYGYTLPIRAP